MSIYNATSLANDKDRGPSHDLNDCNAEQLLQIGKYLTVLATILSAVCLIDSLMFAWYSNCEGNIKRRSISTTPDTIKN